MAGHKVAQAYEAPFYLASVLAATATESHSIFRAPCKCRVRGVSVQPDAAVTGDNTNTKNLNIVNKGSAGSGTTEVGNLDLPTGVSLVAFDDTAIPLNATYLTGVVMSEGDVLALEIEKVGTGVLLPIMQGQIVYEPI